MKCLSRQKCIVFVPTLARGGPKVHFFEKSFQGPIIYNEFLVLIRKLKSILCKCQKCAGYWDVPIWQKWRFSSKMWEIAIFGHVNNQPVLQFMLKRVSFSESAWKTSSEKLVPEPKCNFGPLLYYTFIILKYQ